MKKAWPVRLTDYLANLGVPFKDDAEVYAYGFQMGAEMLLNIASTMFIGYCLGMLIESIVFLAGYILVRKYAGGYHAESALACYIQSFVLIAAALLFCKQLPIDAAPVVAAIFAVVACPAIFLLAPVAATHKPLDAVEMAHYRKKSRIRVVAETTVIFMLLLLGVDRYALVLATGLFLIACLMIGGLVKNKLHPI